MSYTKTITPVTAAHFAAARTKVENIATAIPFLGWDGGECPGTVYQLPGETEPRWFVWDRGENVPAAYRYDCDLVGAFATVEEAELALVEWVNVECS